VRAVKQVQAGKSPEVVIDALGMSRSCIYEWLSKYRSGGWDALKAKRLNGRPRLLSGQQMAWIYKAVTGGNPQQMRLPFALWTLKLIQEVIAEHLGIKLSKASVWRLLQQLGLSAQKPLFKAFQQNPKKVNKWLRHDFPKIKLMAKKVGARIFFGDEAGVRSDFHAGTTWAPKGETPVVEATGARFSMNMISAISNRGEMRFMVVDGSVNADAFIEFLKRLIIDTDRPVFLIVDGHPTHRSVRVRDFVNATNGKLGLFYLPGYSPELNPDEFVWNDLKNNVVGRKTVSSKEGLKSIIVGGLRSIQKRPEKIRSFFQARHTKYAA
jgi:transposase